jgi:hypothetical protein
MMRIFAREKQRSGEKTSDPITRVPLVEPFTALGDTASPATIMTSSSGANATFAFSSVADIGAALRPGRARTLILLLGSHDLTCNTGHQALRLLSTTTIGSSSTGVRDSDGRTQTVRWVGWGDRSGLSDDAG